MSGQSDSWRFLKWLIGDKGGKGMEQIDSSDSQRRRRGALLSYANAITSLVVGLLYVPLLLSGIGKEEYGVYQLVGSVLGYINILNGILSAGTTRFYCTAHASGNEDDMQRVLATCRAMYRRISLVVIAIAMVVIAAFPAVYGGSLSGFQVHECQAMFAILVVNLVITMMNSVYVAVINANERFVFLKGTTLLNSVLQPVVVVSVIRFAPYAISIALVMLTLNAILAIVQNRYAIVKLGGKITQGVCDRKLLHSITLFVAGLLLASVADQIFWRTNQLVLGYFFGAGVVAVYGVGAQIYTSYLSLGNVITSVFLPRVSELCANRRMDLISELFIKVGRLSLYVLLLIYGGFIILGRDFIALWAGPDYSDAYYIALAVMTAFMLDSSQSLGITILQVLDKYRFRAVIYFVLACINVGVVIIAARYVGAVGCAVTSAIFMIIGNGPIMNGYYAKVIGLDIGGFWSNAAKLAAPLAVVIGVFGVLWVLLPIQHGWAQLLTIGAVYAAVFAVTAWVFCMNIYEKSIMRSFISRIWKK